MKRIKFTPVRIALLSLALMGAFFGPPAMRPPCRAAASDDVKVAVLSNFPPQYILDDEGKPSGFAVDVIEEVAALANLRLTYVVKESWDEVFDAVISGECRIIPNQGVTERRKAFFAYTSPVETFSVRIFVRKTTHDVRSLDDLHGRNAAAVRLNVGVPLLAAHPEIRLHVFDHIHEALFQLLSGQVDAFVYPEPVLLKLARQSKVDDRIKAVAAPLKEIKRAVAVRNTDAELLARLETAVRRFVSSDAYEKVYAKWYGRPSPFWTEKTIIYSAVGAVALLVLFLLAWRFHSVMRLNRMLGENIEKRNAAEVMLQKSHDELEQRVKARTEELSSVNRELKTEIAERRRMENSLKQSEERFRIIFEKSPLGIALVGLNYQLIEANKAYCDFLGYTEAELTHLTIKDFTHPDDLAENMALQQKLGRGDIPEFQMEKRFIRSDGEIVHGLLIASLIHHDDGRPLYYMGLVLDITQRKKAEAKSVEIEKEKAKLAARIQQSQKMEAIGALAGGIAHDFNNILFPIIGYSEMVMDDLPAGSLSHRNIAEILKAAKRARDLVQQILTFSRQKEHARKPLKAQLVMKEALKLLRSTIPTTIEFREDIDMDAPMTLGDPSQVHQIIMNLCTNAYHAMQDAGGVLEASLDAADIGVGDNIGKGDLPPGRYLRICVSDTGGGISPEIVDKIFDPYFTTKPQGKGTGLGLSVVHGIVKSYGGEISVYSEPGRGSRFFVYLPAVASAEIDEAPQPESPIETGREHVLLVDDEQQIVEMERQMLTRLGYAVTTRTSSVEALETFRFNPAKFDIVITDMTMPNMTGLTLSRELMRIRPDIPVILCTGFSEAITKEKAAGYGIRGYLMKPVVKRDLATAVRRALDQSPVTDSLK